MITTTSFADLPSDPGVYAMIGGEGRSQYVAYVGMGSKLRGRIEQHLIRRDSSVTTGVSAVCLNPDFVTGVRWWLHDRFTEPDALAAAELIAFETLNPALRSRGSVSNRAKKLSEEAEFNIEMRALFSGDATGELAIRSLNQAWDKIDALESQLREIEKRLSQGE